MTKDSCRIEIHHDLVGAEVHYTTTFDATVHKAWKQIENELLSVYGTSFEI
jgi:hypothetical protein